MSQALKEARVQSELAKQFIASDISPLERKLLDQFESQRVRQVHLLTFGLPPKEVNALRIALTVRTAEVLEGFELSLVQVANTLGLRSPQSSRRDIAAIKARYADFIGAICHNFVIPPKRKGPKVADAISGHPAPYSQGPLFAEIGLH